MDSAQVNVMRAIAEAHMFSEATILRPQLTSDGGGGFDTVWEDQTGWEETSMYICNYAPTRSDRGYTETMIAERLGTATPWTFTFAHDADVRNQDRIQTDGRTFEVSLVLEQSFPHITTRVLCKELTS